MNPPPSILARTGGVLLAGGRSQRFGSEKAMALFHGRPLMDVVAERFDQCAAFAVSARDGAAAARRAGEAGVEILNDDPRHPAGPLAGVCAGLHWAKGKGLEFLATAPCDSPNLPHDLFSVLLNDSQGAPAAYAITDEGEFPLCAVWSTALEAPLSQILNSGAHPAVRAFLATHGARRVSFADTQAFANANTAEDLIRAEHSP